MDKSEYELAASYWTSREKDQKKMDEKELKEAIDSFLQSHNTCALATGAGEFVRCTPIEYNYFDDKIWIITEGGLKFKALEENKNVCIAVYDSYEGFGKLGGMQVSGKAEVIEPFGEEYLKVLEVKKLPVESLKKLSHTMYILKISIERIDFLCSEFKKKGCDSRQFIEF